ncbi:uncharacterized protein K452DRAFT_125361 [Aplosporella prunicola CBS 121167]|uniref:Peptidase A2 domain-containing protein n=1 Tax=Aplosporella prunicola CBS 121167 TaxID=1176127 RepID=A0A6A6BSH7_9PEZI|nr:uncharacterized protein K452DRAFT_125361 [Aplosporella prunicola CBS 121167]KAF2145777.1 hypothetical protein K452DRAFT_125361 [Aplosporella prunicola CBS 121167]
MSWQDHVLKYFREMLPKLGPPKCKKVYEIHGMLDEINTIAIPDTGASVNTINTAFAQTRGYRLKSGPENRTKIKTPNGHETFSDGIVELYWTFADSPDTKHNLVFHAVTESPNDILLGMPFLEATGALTTHARRITIRKRVAESNKRNVRFQSINDSALPRARGQLDKRDVLALADTGSKVNIMSLDYAKQHGYTIDCSPDAIGALQFANGAEEQTIGRVMARWRFANGTDEHLLAFDVLKHSHYDLVVGQDVLFETGAFNNHAESIVYHVASLEQNSGRPYCPINSVRRSPKFFRGWNKSKGKGSEDGLAAQPATLGRNAELERRAKAQILIDSMPDVPAKDAAIEVEKQRCSAWHSQQPQRQQQASTTRSSSQNASTSADAGSSQRSASYSSGSSRT